MQNFSKISTLLEKKFLPPHEVTKTNPYIPKEKELNKQQRSIIMEKITCQACMHSSEPFEVAGHTVVECRFAPPTVNGFPVVNTDAFCSNGNDGNCDNMLKEDIPSSPEDMSQYTTYKDIDGSMITLHIPTAITMIHQKMKLLEQDMEYLMRQRS